MSNSLYDKLKFLAQIAIPAAATLIAALGGIWGFDTDKIVGTIIAIDTFLGVLLGISTYKYNKSLALENEESEG